MDINDTLNGRLHLQDLYTNGEASTSLNAKNAELSPITVKPNYSGSHMTYHRSFNPGS
jgi:hypothetical protein